MQFFVILLLIIVAIFGIASGMQSYATAQQAQATIEVAKAAKVEAYGNLITILVLALAIVAVLGLVVWLAIRSAQRSSTGGPRAMPRVIHPPALLPAAPPATLDDLIKLETLRALRAMNGAAPALPADRSVPHDADDLSWLRKS